MEDLNLLESLKEKLTCSFCLRNFKDPVTVRCGHSLCKECLFKAQERDRTSHICPQCRTIFYYEDHLRSDERWKNLAEASRLLRPHLRQILSGLTICDQHGREESLFCENDQRPLCGPCVSSTEHKEHRVLPLEKAADLLMERLQASSKILRRKLQDFQSRLNHEKVREVQYKKKSLVSKELALCEYENMHQMLMAEELFHLQRLDRETKEVMAKLRESQAILCKKIENLQMIMVYIESNAEKPPKEVLKKNPLSLWNDLSRKMDELQLELECVKEKRTRCQLKVQAMKWEVRSEYQTKQLALAEEEELYLQALDQDDRENLAKFKEIKSSLCQLINNIEGMMAETEDNFEKPLLQMLLDGKGTLERSEELLLQDPRMGSLTWTMCPMPVTTKMLMSFHRDLTLDPETADSHVIVSDDLKSVKYAPVKEDLRRKGPQTLGFCKIVLATQRFISGKHYWEIEVGGESPWEVGVCNGSDYKEKSTTRLAWMVCVRIGFQFQNDISLENLHGNQDIQPIKKFGIFLDYERRCITFYNATDRTLLCSLPNLDFHGPLFPCFSPVVKNEESAHGHLIMCPMKKQ